MLSPSAFEQKLKDQTRGVSFKFIMEKIPSQSTTPNGNPSIIPPFSCPPQPFAELADLPFDDVPTILMYHSHRPLYPDENVDDQSEQKPSPSPIIDEYQPSPSSPIKMPGLSIITLLTNSIMRTPEKIFNFPKLLSPNC